MNTLEEIASSLSRIGSAVIFTHTRPDGDTLGSGLALCRALRMSGKRATVVNDGAIPEKFFFVEGIGEVGTAVDADAAAYICVDASEESRLGGLEGAYRAGARRKLTFNIDHHVSNTRYAKYNYVVPCSSCCEIVSKLVRALGVTPDKPLADALMLGMVTDSGGFSHSDVNGDTFREAAFAADAGGNAARVSYEMMKRQTKARAAMYAETVSRLRYFNNDSLAVAVVTDGTLQRYGLAQDATEGIVDFGLSVDRVEVSVCLLEVKKGQYKASFRSKGRVNVNEIARLFGGGGHVLASGCMFFGDLEEILDRVRDAVDRYSGEV